MSSSIEDYALIGDGKTAALINRTGSVDWPCWPRFDSDACFAALLGTTENGCWRISPNTAVRSINRRYRQDTLVLETDLQTGDATIRIIDFMPECQTSSSSVRIVVGVRGRVSMRSELRLRFDYGSLPPWCEATESGVVARVGPDMIVFRAPVPLEIHQHCQKAEFIVSEGERIAFVLSHSPASDALPGPIDAEKALMATQPYWRDWISRFDDNKTKWQLVVRRSLITLSPVVAERGDRAEHSPPSGRARPSCPPAFRRC